MVPGTGPSGVRMQLCASFGRFRTRVCGFEPVLALLLSAGREGGRERGSEVGREEGEKRSKSRGRGNKEKIEEGGTENS